MKPHITLFLNNGATLRFDDVTPSKGLPIPGAVFYEYASVSDGKRKTIGIFLDKVVAVSIFEGDTDAPPLGPA